MGFSAIATAVAATAAVAGTAYSIDQQGDAQDAQNKAAKQERAMAEIENARKRRRAVAQQAIQQGQINNAAAISGTIGSTGPTSASGALKADFESGLAYGDSALALNNSRLSFLSSASNAQANAQLGSTIAQLGAQLGGTDWSSFMGGSGTTTPTTTPKGPQPGTNPGYSTPMPGGYRTGVSFQRLG